MPSVLITSGNRGLGLEFARQYAADGWAVLAACRDPKFAASLHDLAKTSRVRTLQMDVTSVEMVRRAAAELEGESIDVLLNTAGVVGAPKQTIGNMDYESWAEVLDVNTMGPLRAIEAFTDHLARSDRKLVVTITSGMGSLADNTSGGSIAYRSSKAAVNMVMRSAAIDLAPRGITCVLLNPGWVKTDMGGPNASITPQESVTALRQTISGLGPAQSGKFLHYDGRPYPW